MIDLDEVLVHLGQFGKYQKIVYFLICITALFCAQPVVMLTFVSYLPLYRCFIPGCDEKENPEYETNFLNFTIPFKNSNDNSDELILDKCNMYGRNTNDSRSLINKVLSQTYKWNEHVGQCNEEDFSQNKVECDSWVFDNEEYQIKSVAIDFDLTCGNEFFIPFEGSAYMIGMMLGAVSIGAFSDKFGRKPGFLLSTLLMAGGGFMCAFSFDIYTFLVGRFIAGFGAVALFQVAFIIAIEFVGMKYRTFCGILINVPFALGEASVGGLAYLIRDWRWLIISICGPSLIMILFMWILPESARWLISKGRTDDAITIIKKVANINNATVPDHLLKDYNESPEEKSSSSSSSKSLLDLFKIPNMRKRTLNMFQIWMVCTLTYYGLSLNSGNLGGNIYVNFLSTMLIEIPSYIFAYLVLDRMGRKGTLTFVMVLGGISCFIGGFIPQDIGWLTVTLSLIGKFGISAAFAIIYMYSAELFPTDYRSVAVGACSTCARIGGILAPFVAESAKVYEPLPLMIFGGLSIISGLMVLLLPETAGAQLAETLEESENFGTDQDLFYFICLKPKKKTDS